MSTNPLAPILIELLVGHGVAAELREGVVFVPSTGSWANLWMTGSDGRSARMELRASTADGGVVIDRWAAFGADDDAARADGLRSFCSSVFHVALAGLWGVLERDQVEHGVAEVAGATWDVYEGPCTRRVSDGVTGLDLPREVLDAVLAALHARLSEGSTHALRLYVAFLNGVMTTEVVIDDELAPDVAESVAAAPWIRPETGFASLRWFVLARRRDGGPCHLVERACCG